MAAAVQYYDSDFSYEEHAAQCSEVFAACLATTASPSAPPAPPAPPAADVHPVAQADCWDGFHSSHSTGNFFKSRRYITKCFPCILDHCASLANSEEEEAEQQQRSRNRVILEIGCGTGSSCVPILKQILALDPSNGNAPNSVLLACDSSPVAVETTRRCVEKAVTKSADLDKGFAAFVSDPSLGEDESDESLLQSAVLAYRQLSGTCDESIGSNIEDKGIADITLCVFVLSALAPARCQRFLNQLYHTTRPGGKVCFRDYGMYDLPMMRFEAKDRYVNVDSANGEEVCVDFDGNAPRLFLRGDGTLSRFFHIETVEVLFRSAGFFTEELRYATVFNENRKTKQRLKRVFVHGLFARPRPVV